MDYTELAAELIDKMHSLQKASMQRKINEALQGETFVLDYIACHGDDVLPGEISHEMEVSSARVAAALNNLEKKGMLTRHVDMHDRRKILVRLTREGREFAEEKHKIIIEEAARVLNLLDEHDAKEYVRITGKLAEAAHNLSGRM